MPDPLPQKDDLRVVVLVREGRGGREGAPQNLQKRKKHKVSAGIVAWDGRATSAGASDASPKKGVGCGDHSPPAPQALPLQKEIVEKIGRWQNIFQLSEGILCPGETPQSQLLG